MATKPKMTEAEAGAYNALRDAFVKILKIDLALYGHGRLGGQMRPFVELGLTADDLETWEEWYYANDWRGKKGETPTIKIITETYRQAFVPKGKSPRPPKPAPTPTPVTEGAAPALRLPSATEMSVLELEYLEFVDAAAENILSSMPDSEVAALIKGELSVLLSSEKAATYARWTPEVLDNHCRLLIARRLAQGKVGSFEDFCRERGFLTKEVA